jgi:hypothetical protein
LRQTSSAIDEIEILDPNATSLDGLLRAAWANFRTQRETGSIRQCTVRSKQALMENPCRTAANFSLTRQPLLTAAELQRYGLT